VKSLNASQQDAATQLKGPRVGVGKVKATFSEAAVFSLSILSWERIFSLYLYLYL
jgi:hypothetical protein